MSHRDGVRAAYAAMVAGRFAEGMTLLDEAENCGGPDKRPAPRTPNHSQIKKEVCDNEGDEDK